MKKVLKRVDPSGLLLYNDSVINQWVDTWVFEK